MRSRIAVSRSVGVLVWGLGALLLGLATGTALGKTNYVSKTGGVDTHGGTGWGDAWLSLTNAVAKAVAGDTILVSNGTYNVTAYISVNKALTINGFGDASGTNVVVDGGGASGTGFYPVGQDLTMQDLTIQNCRNTLTGGGAFYINGGTNFLFNRCTFATNSTGANMSGGALYLFSSIGNYSFSNCTFTANVVSNGGSGGAFYISKGSNLTFTSCAFRGNYATGSYYGAVGYVNAGTSFVMNACAVSNNVDLNSSGGYVLIITPAAGCVSTITNCTFAYNTAPASQQANTIYFYNANQIGNVYNCQFTGNTNGSVQADTKCILSVASCSFVSNTTVNGGAGVNFLNGIVSGCGFTNNSAALYGGAVYMPQNCTGVTVNCSFTSNNSSGGGNNSYGGALNLSDGTVSNCIFVGNYTTNAPGTANYGGGAIGMVYAGSYNKTVYGCTFSNNWSASGGGAILFAGTGTVQNCLFVGNQSTSNAAGAIYTSGATSPQTETIRNCVFVGNQAYANGGAIWLSYGNNVVDSCTIAQNCSVNGSSGGGGIYQANGAGYALNYLINCIVYSNFWKSVTNNVFLQSPASNVISYCCLTTNGVLQSPNVFTACTTNYPQFVNAGSVASGSSYGTNLLSGTYDFRLRKGSPCIDKGTTEGWMTGVKDLAGNDRVIGAGVDIGAYEYKPSGNGTAVLFR